MANWPQPSKTAILRCLAAPTPDSTLVAVIDSDGFRHNLVEADLLQGDMYLQRNHRISKIAFRDVPDDWTLVFEKRVKLSDYTRGEQQQIGQE